MKFRKPQYKWRLRATLISAPLVLLMLPVAHAQETRGQADVALQGYYLNGASQPAVSTTGLAVNFQYYFDKSGHLQLHAEPYYDKTGARTGENYFNWHDVAWQGFRWSFSGGDFRLQMRPSEITQANLYFPELRLRGARMDMRTGSATFSFFTGQLMVLQGNRLPFMYRTPQQVTGASLVWKKTEKLQVESTLARIGTDLRRLASEYYFLSENRRFRSSIQSSTNAIWRPVKGLKFYGETSFSSAPKLDGQPDHAWFSGVGAAEYEAGRWLARAQVQREGAAFMPLAGYFLGDRQGPSGEVRYQATQRITLFGSASRISNNVENADDVPTFRSTSATAGASAQLPGRFFALANYSIIGLRAQMNKESQTTDSQNRLAMLSVMKPIHRHNLRFSWRELSLRSTGNPSRMRSLEFEDNVALRHLSIGGGMRMDNRLGNDPLTTYYFRGNAQVHVKRLSAYAFGEIGRDRLNQTLFIANQMSTTVIGISSPITHDWVFSAEMVRNTLKSELNSMNIFLLTAQGAPMSAVMDGLNRWNLFFRVSRTFRWGSPLPGQPGVRGVDHLYPVLGTVEGVVREAGAPIGPPVANVPVSLDGVRTEVTDANGVFRFVDVAQGEHVVQLPSRELPADLDPASASEKRVTVAARQTARAQFEVLRLGSVSGKLVSPIGARVSDIIVRLEGLTRYTTPDEEGNFSFHNLPPGIYDAVVDVSTLPQDCRPVTPMRMRFVLGRGDTPPDLLFRIERFAELKPVRKVILSSR